MTIIVCKKFILLEFYFAQANILNDIIISKSLPFTFVDFQPPSFHFQFDFTDEKARSQKYIIMSYSSYLIIEIFLENLTDRFQYSHIDKLIHNYFHYSFLMYISSCIKPLMRKRRALVTNPIMLITTKCAC